MYFNWRKPEYQQKLQQDKITFFLMSVSSEMEIYCIGGIIIGLIITQSFRGLLFLYSSYFMPHRAD